MKCGLETFSIRTLEHTVAKRSSRKAVLIVDDNSEIRRHLHEVFTVDDFEVCAEADNGRAAIEQAGRHRPELIILDLSMPVMTGWDAAPKLRKIVPKTPIILYTLFAESISPTDLKEQGITAVVSKNEPIVSLVQKAENLFQN